MSLFNQRVVAVINKSIPVGNAMNTLGHISVALGSILGPEALQLIDYQDKNETIYPGISKMPFVILRATGGKIRSLKEQAEEKNIKYRCFTDSMTIGTWQEQLDKTKTTKTDDLTFWGILLYGPNDQVTEWTKKFSLFK